MRELRLLVTFGFAVKSKSHLEHRERDNSKGHAFLHETASLTHSRQFEVVLLLFRGGDMLEMLSVCVHWWVSMYVH